MAHNEPQILHTSLQRFIEKINVIDDVLVVNFAALEQLQLFEHLALHHRHCIVCVVLSLCWLLQQILSQYSIAKHTLSSQGCFPISCAFCW